MPSCDQIARELSDALDGDVPFWRLMQIRTHLAMCRKCRDLESSLERTVGVLGSLSEMPLEDMASEETPEDDDGEGREGESSRGEPGDGSCPG